LRVQKVSVIVAGAVVGTRMMANGWDAGTVQNEWVGLESPFPVWLLVFSTFRCYLSVFLTSASPIKLFLSHSVSTPQAYCFSCSLHHGHIATPCNEESSSTVSLCDGSAWTLGPHPREVYVIHKGFLRFSQLVKPSNLWLWSSQEHVGDNGSNVTSRDIRHWKGQKYKPPYYP
jgi:hypothetical protein